jgi:hypothetical protein
MKEIDEVLKDLKRGLRDLKDAEGDYEDAVAFYAGEDPEIFVSDALRVYFRGDVGFFRLNLASVPVDATVDRLYIKGFTSTDSATQKELDRIVKENDLWLWSNDAMRDGEMYGDEYIAVMVGDDERPVLSPLDPLSTRVIYDEELERIPEFMVRKWVEKEGREDEIERATISYPDYIYKFYRGKGAGGEEGWSRYELDGEAWPKVNEIQDVPVGHLRNGMPYGSPGHKKSYGMQQMITKGILNMAVNIDFMGFRQRYAVTKPDDLGGATSMPNLPKPTPRTKDGQPVEDHPAAWGGSGPDLTTGPGKLWKLIADMVGEFEPTDVEQFVKLLDWCKRAMANAERMPVREFDNHMGQAPSGESQLQSDKPFKQRIESRKRSMGAAWVDALSKALKIVDSDRKWGPIEVEWDREDVSSNKEEYEAAGMAAALIQQAYTGPHLKPFVLQKLQELGYSTKEAELFLAEVGKIEVTPPVPGKDTEGINDDSDSSDETDAEE